MTDFQNGEAEIDFKVTVVLPAAGTGERFGCKEPKQFSPLLDKPLIFYTISAFHRLSWIQEIVVVVSKQYNSYINELKVEYDFEKVMVTEGATTRHRSIYAGIKLLSKDKPDTSIVIIHDAARPFVDEDVIKQVAISARNYGAAGMTRPLVSTVIAGDKENLLIESLDRTKYLNSEMPQAFILSIIKMAYDKADDHDFNFGTECLLLAMKYTKTRAKLIPGPDNLWKVTYKKDLYSAENLLKEQLISVSLKFVSCSQDEVMINCIESTCTKRSIQFQNLESFQASSNSVIYVYDDLNDQQITLNTSNYHNESSPSKKHDISIASCIIHVYKGPNVIQDEVNRFMKSLTDLQTKFPLVLSFGILYCGDDISRLSEMVVTLIWNRDKSLSGQTFRID